MRVDIISCLPELLVSPFSHSIIQRAQKKGLVQIEVHNLRDYGEGKYRQIDDKPYGGEAGMVLMAGPIVRCIEKLKQERSYDGIIYMAPEGELLNQSLSNKLSLQKNMIILCGHYKGIDERVRTHFITQEISIGRYVLSGGELPAAVVVDSVVRLLPGVLTDETSALTDSFQDGQISHPVYTRPAFFRDLPVPEVLRSGHRSRIDAWKEALGEERTISYNNREKKEKSGGR